MIDMSESVSGPFTKGRATFKSAAVTLAEKIAPDSSMNLCSVESIHHPKSKGSPKARKSMRSIKDTGS